MVNLRCRLSRALRRGIRNGFGAEIWPKTICDFTENYMKFL